jgi:hypothetical protein
MVNENPPAEPAERPLTHADRKTVVETYVRQVLATATEDPRRAILALHAGDLSYNEQLRSQLVGNALTQLKEFPELLQALTALHDSNVRGIKVVAQLTELEKKFADASAGGGKPRLPRR